MRRIASTQELQSALRDILAYAQTQHPSRKRIAAALTNVSVRLAGGYYGIPATVRQQDYALRLLERISMSDWAKLAGKLGLRVNQFPDEGTVRALRRDQISYIIRELRNVPAKPASDVSITTKQIHAIRNMTRRFTEQDWEAVGLSDLVHHDRLSHDMLSEAALKELSREEASAVIKKLIDWYNKRAAPPENPRWAPWH